MNKDIVRDMVDQMGLTPQIAEQLQQQQHQSQMYQPQHQQQPSMGSYSPGGPGLPSTPEEQMRLMEAAQNAQQGQPVPVPPQYEGGVDSSESDSVSDTVSTESDIDLEKVGLNSPPKSMIDSIMDYLKDPLIVIVLFFIISLSQVGDMIKKVLPPVVTSNIYYFIGVKALLMGSAFLTSKLVIS